MGTDDDFHKVAAASKKGGTYRFTPYKHQDAELVAQFRPNRSPKEVIQAGAFGGTYFRDISSKATRSSHKDAWKEFSSWWTGIKVSNKLSRNWSDYSIAVNKYGVKCGQTLDQWEGAGWILKQDPYGWFQWYCRFFRGRRSPDDARQIKRWLNLTGPSGRFRNTLINKCRKNKAAYNDKNISPVIRQTLLHWGYELTASDFNASADKKKVAMAARKTVGKKKTSAKKSSSKKKGKKSASKKKSSKRKVIKRKSKKKKSSKRKKGSRKSRR